MLGACDAVVRPSISFSLSLSLTHTHTLSLLCLLLCARLRLSVALCVLCLSLSVSLSVSVSPRLALVASFFLVHAFCVVVAYLLALSLASTHSFLCRSLFLSVCLSANLSVGVPLLL